MSSPGTWLQRFLTNVEHEGECWIWQARTHQGYGVYGGRVAAITECKNGHPFNEQNTRFRGTFRHCRVCERQRTAEYKARKRATAVTP